MRRVHALAAALSLLLTSLAAGDIVRMKDGREFVGVIKKETASTIVIDTKVANIRTMLTLRKSNIANVERGDPPPGFLDDEPAAPTTNRPDRPRRREREEALRRSSVPDRPAQYIEIPIEGVFGEDIVPVGVQESLEYAVRRDVQHVVFRINSDGGYVWAAEDIAQIMEEHAEDLTYHALIDKAISASIWVALSCDTIHMRPGSSIGAAVVFSQDATTGDAQVDAKMNSAIAARLASRAEANGHSAAIVRAMILQEAEAYLVEDEFGERVTDTRPGGGRAMVLDDRDSVLTLTADEAANVGFASLFDGEASRLAGAVGLDGWRRASRFGAAAMRKARERAAPLLEEIPSVASIIGRDITEAVDSDPGNYQYYLQPFDNRMTQESRRQWRQRTDDAIAAWTRVGRGLVKLERLERRLAELGFSRSIHELDLEDLRERSAREIDRLRRDRDKDSF